jgi:putative hydrolase of the HAD superfamily
VNVNEAPEPTPYPANIRAVIFDYGGVISLPADPEVIIQMAESLGLTEERFRHLYGYFRHAYDRGTYSAAEYWKQIADAAGRELSSREIDDLRKSDVAVWGRVNPDILLWAERLRTAGYKTAILSNMHDDMVQHIQSCGDWAKRFNCLTLSSAIGMAKPEPEIFEYCLKCLDVQPNEAMFIDDREPNTEAAIQAGLLGILAPTPEELKNTLSAVGFRPLPEV